MIGMIYVRKHKTVVYGAPCFVLLLMDLHASRTFSRFLAKCVIKLLAGFLFVHLIAGVYEDIKCVVDVNRWG